MKAVIGQSILVGSLFCGVVCSGAEPLRYKWPEEGLLAYKIEVKAETPTQLETMKGVITYRLKKSGAAAALTFSGGLTKTTKKKPGSASSSTRRRGFGGPPLPPRPFGPFTRTVNPYKGLERTTSQVVIDNRGELMSMSGSSQLPWLLGNLSLLVFEPLPEGDDRSWTVDSGTTISEKKKKERDPFGPGGRFGPFGPFGPRDEDNDEKITSATTMTSFEFKGETEEVAEFDRTYRMETLEADTQFLIESSGTWKFNTKLGASESLDVAQKCTITLKEKNVTFKIPLTIKYDRLSPEDYETYQKNREAAIAKSKEAARIRPYMQGGYLNGTYLWVTEDMELPKDMLILWRKDHNYRYWSARVVENLPDGKVLMKELGYKKRTMPWPRGWLNLPPRDIPQPDSIPNDVLDDLYAKATLAEKIDREYIARFKTRKDIAKSNAASPIESQERTQLLEELASGEPRIIDRALTLITLRSPREDEELHEAVKSHLESKVPFIGTAAKKALPKVLASAKSPKMTTSAAPRTWSDSSGKFKVEATFVTLDGEFVSLKRKSDGKTIRVPLKRLSDDDQATVKALIAGDDEDPFN